MRLAAICGLIGFMVSVAASPVLAQENPPAAAEAPAAASETPKPAETPEPTETPESADATAANVPDQPWSAQWVTSLSSFDQQDFVAATADGLLMREAAVVLFNRNDLSKIKTLYTHPASVWAVAATDAYVCSADYRGNLGLMNRASGTSEVREGVLERWTRALAVSPDGKSLVAGNEAGKLFVWSFEKGEVIQTTEAEKQQIYSLAFSASGDKLAVSNGAGHVEILSWPDLTQIRKLELGEQPVWGAVFTSDGESVLAGGADRKLWLAPIAEGSPAAVLSETNDWISSIQASQDGGAIVIGTLAGELLLANQNGTSVSVIGTAPSAVWTASMPSSDTVLAGTRKHAVVSLGQAWEVKYAAEPGSDASGKAD